jgi:hypothetical protein
MKLEEKNCTVVVRFLTFMVFFSQKKKIVIRFMRQKIFYILFSLCISNIYAQKTYTETIANGENVIYDLYFKWGVIMSRAGEATLSYRNDKSIPEANSRYRMTFKTTKFFDGIFKMRDTLDCYLNSDYKVAYSRKGSDEGNYYLVDELRLKHEQPIKIHSKRYTREKIKIDTTLTATGEVMDMLGALFYLRGVDRTKLKSGDKFPITIAIGRDLVKMQFVYQNQAIVEREKLKYNTRYFKIDIFDDAFESMKSAAEVWVGDDDNFLPVKIRSKLKIGYAEIYYKTSTGLANPLTCRYEMK